jgi:Alpha/beta hydrolase domain
MTSVAHQGVNPAMPKGVCALPYNLTDCRPLMRAALVALDRWVKEGTPAPASRYPRIADGTLVPSVKLNPAAAPASSPTISRRRHAGSDARRKVPADCFDISSVPP